jgi:hypothetical protein
MIFTHKLHCPPPGLLAINLGKNKESADAADDYAVGVIKLAR